jgi:dCTP deaminase
MVVPFDEELLNPASLDLRLGDYLMVESIYSPDLVRISIADKTEDDPFMLQSGEFCLAETLELFNHLLAGWCDPGWHGSKLTLELKNERLHHALPLYPGLKIGQMVFHAMSNAPMHSYAETGHYNNHLTVMPSVA